MIGWHLTQDHLKIYYEGLVFKETMILICLNILLTGDVATSLTPASQASAIPDQQHHLGCQTIAGPNDARFKNPCWHKCA